MADQGDLKSRVGELGGAKCQFPCGQQRPETTASFLSVPPYRGLAATQLIIADRKSRSTDRTSQIGILPCCKAIHHEVAWLS